VFAGLIFCHILVAYSIFAISCFEQIYRKANAAYDALSMRLGDQAFLFDNRYIVSLCFVLYATYFIVLSYYSLLLVIYFSYKKATFAEH
jgi:hypothetical protein